MTISQILSLLFEANRKLPAAIPHAERDDMLLTLLFWFMLSQAQRGKANYPNVAWRSPVAAHMANNNRVSLNDSCMYESCQWDNANGAAIALRAALFKLEAAQANHSLTGVLRLERFGEIGLYHSCFKNSPGLAKAIDLIGGIQFDQSGSDSSIGTIFGRAREMLETERLLQPGQTALDAMPPNVANLLATLLNPLPGESVYDPTCGNGQLLLACMAQAAQQTPQPQLLLYGQESNASQWAMARMRLITSGALAHQLERGYALDKPLFIAGSVQMFKADVVLTRIQEQASNWNYRQASDEKLSRFPKRPPVDSRLAMVWHLLACMKPETGRMACLVPMAALMAGGGKALLTHLVLHNLLDALIALPEGMRQQPAIPHVILLARHGRQIDTVALISGQGMGQHRAHDMQAIQSAWSALIQKQNHPCLRTPTANLIARQGWPFDLGEKP